MKPSSTMVADCPIKKFWVFKWHNKNKKCQTDIIALVVQDKDVNLYEEHLPDKVSGFKIESNGIPLGQLIGEEGAPSTG